MTHTDFTRCWIAIAVALVPTVGHAHGGGLDANGGHHDRRTGRYHCHRAPCRTVQPKSPLAPRAAPSATPPAVPSATPPAVPAVSPPVGGASPADAQSPAGKAADLCPLGRPRHVKDLGPTAIIARAGYVLEHSARYKVPLWVCERVEARHLHGHARRRNRFKPDPELEGQPRAELDDYRHSGFDRGHMAPAGDYVSDQTLKDASFYLSNMAPQDPSLNRRIWRSLEERVRDWSEAWGAVWVVTGAMFYDPEEDDPALADGVVDYRTIGPGQVAVPTHFFKIVVREDADGGLEVVAFNLENHGYPSPYDFEDLTRSVDWIEERTGLDFLPALDPATAASLESVPARPWHSRRGPSTQVAASRSAGTIPHLDHQVLRRPLPEPEGVHP